MEDERRISMTLSREALEKALGDLACPLCGARIAFTVIPGSGTVSDMDFVKGAMCMGDEAHRLRVINPVTIDITTYPSRR